MVMVTHDARAATIADRVLFLADGVIEASCPRSDPSAMLAAMNELSQMIRVALARTARTQAAHHA